MSWCSTFRYYLCPPIPEEEDLALLMPPRTHVICIFQSSGIIISVIIMESLLSIYSTMTTSLSSTYIHRYTI